MSHWAPVCCGALAILIVVLFTTTAVLGQPNQPQLDVTIQSFPGVQRVVVTTANKKPVAADLELQVVGILRDYGSTNQSVSVDLTIAAGGTTGVAELPILIPIDSWYRMVLHLERDRNGAYGPRDFMTTNIQATGFGARTAEAHLFVSSNLTAIPEETFNCSPKSQVSYGQSGLSVADPAALPSLRHLAPLLENQIGLGTVTSDISLLQNANEIFKSIHPNDFFGKWTSLALFESVLISHGDLVQLAGSPAKLDALRKWLAAGGQAMVFDCGASCEKRDEVLELLRGNTSGSEREWQQASEKLNAIKDNLAADTSLQPPAVYDAVVDDDIPQFTKFVPATEIADQPWLKTDFMRGSLFVVGSDMRDWPEKNWRSLYNALRLSGSSVVSTLGENPLNRGYDQNFAIPGIGKPPVLAFQILIGLFVAVIGPGFYFFFNATGRLYLLLITTPLFALAAVLTLVGYGIISDGFAVQGRVASVTEIDHATSHALTHSRHNFYSGVAPRECVFNDETLVVDSRAGFSSLTRYRFGNDRLSVSGGQIKARSPFQLTSLTSFQTDQKLKFTQNGSDESTGSIANGFDDSIEIAIVRTDSGWFLAEHIAPQTAVTAKSVDPGETRDKMRAFLFFPEPAATARYRGRGFSYRRYGNYYPDDSLGGWGLSAQVIPVLAAGPDENNMPVGSYIAIMRTNKMVADPQPTAIYGKQGENQLHVIVGKW